MAKNQKRRPTKAEAGAKIAPASVNRGGGYYDQKTSEDQLAYIERQLAAGERARQNRQAPEDDGEYWNLESESEQIAYIENQLKVAEQNRQTRQEAATRKTSGKVARPDGVQTTAEPAAKSGKTPYDQTAAQQQRRASADYWQQAAEQAATAQDREQAYTAIRISIEAVPAAKELWELDRGNHPRQAMGTLRRRAQELYNGMTEQERRTYDRMSELYDSYGRLWSVGHRTVQDVTGLAQQIGGSFATLPQALGAATVDNAREAAAQSAMNTMLANGTAYVQDENGNMVESEEFRRAREDFEAGRAEAETVLTPENSPGVALYQAGSERVANAQAGLGEGAKFAVNTANSIVGNAPAMALAAVPVVGQAASLGLMGAQAAGGRAAELSMEGETATRALTRGLVSGGIEVLTEKVPVGEWVNLVKGPAKEGVQQAVMAVLRQMGSEATEEAASYVLNYAADVAAQDPNAEFSLAELAENALGGAISGGVYGGVGVGVNRMLNRGVRTQQNAGQDAAEPAPQDAPQEGAGTAQAAAAEADGTQEGRQGEAAAEAENGQPRTTYEQAQAAELGRLFGLQPNAAAAKMQQDAGSAAPVQQGTVSAGAAQNRRQVEQLAAELELPEQAVRALSTDYDGSVSPAVYAKAWTDAYDAGRTGSLTAEQAAALGGSAAAVAGQGGAMRRAYALGVQEAGTLTPHPAGTAQRGGTVEYQGTGASVVPDEVLQAVAARYGVDVDVVNELASEDGRAANGMWAAGIARITLGENSGNSYQTLNHELTHYIDSVNPEGWARLKNQILVYAASQGMNELQAQAIGPYEGAYGRGAIAADEAARDILAGVMSTEENVQTFCEHVAADQTASPQEKRSILQALRDMLDKVVQVLRGLMRRGDAAAGSEYGRRLAEARDSRELVETYLAELDTAAEMQRGGTQRPGQQKRPRGERGGTGVQH